MTALIIGMATDPTIRYFCQHAKNLTKKAVLFINQSDLGENIRVSDQGLHYRDTCLKHESITCLWNRLFLLPQTKHDCLKAQVYTLFMMDEVYNHVINKPKDCMSNHAKVYQLQLLKLNRLKIPESHITTTPHRFLQALRPNQKPEQWVYKSCSGIRSIVNTFSKKYPHSIKQYAVTEPTLIQQTITGQNLRVHVIDQQCFTVACKSLSIDYRYCANTIIEPYCLAASIADECLDICQQLKLTFAGIDLIRCGQDYYLLEVNAAPGYHWFDRDQSITRALLQFMVSPWSQSKPK